jgi:hypothetical protein
MLLALSQIMGRILYFQKSDPDPSKMDGHTLFFTKRKHVLFWRDLKSLEKFIEGKLGNEIPEEKPKVCHIFHAYRYSTDSGILYRIFEYHIQTRVLDIHP